MNPVDIVTESPLGQSPIGWVLGVILVFIGGVVVMYLRTVTIPAAKQNLEIGKAKAETEMETTRQFADGIRAISNVANATHNLLADHSNKLDKILDKIGE